MVYLIHLLSAVADPWVWNLLPTSMHLERSYKCCDVRWRHICLIKYDILFLSAVQKFSHLLCNVHLYADCYMSKTTKCDMPRSMSIACWWSVSLFSRLSYFSELSSSITDSSSALWRSRCCSTSSSQISPRLSRGTPEHTRDKPTNRTQPDNGYTPYATVIII